MDKDKKELEDELKKITKEKEVTDKKLLTLKWVIVISSTVILIATGVLGAYFPIEGWRKVVLLLVGFTVSLVGSFVALRIEQLTGYYKCDYCEHTYVPSYKTISLAPHMGKMRFMQCPNCKKKSWQRKILNKNKK
jgi:hypothetical protein